MNKTAQPNVQDAILFDINHQTFSQMTLGEHLSRLQKMGDYLSDAILRNNEGLSQMREYIKNQTSQIKTAYQIIQNQTKDQLQRLKKSFDPAMAKERGVIGDMKKQVSKLNGEQLANKKGAVNLEAAVDKCEREIGFQSFKKENAFRE